MQYRYYMHDVDMGSTEITRVRVLWINENRKKGWKAALSGYVFVADKLLCVNDG